ncbi:aspartyl-phosphate phosphatase Spo0E family protein [Desulfolucanica intricata]|uniref:aspartyl-phosphate phosphatase Spo0E family protein n=1 Tax=Desulfolucanica intricata TaxID=1285191 RepID=UPI0008346B9A|nr:aspartyl-phosphate phosphatase Spo0E family protein [Desulfolucanica intricata]
MCKNCEICKNLEKQISNEAIKLQELVNQKGNFTDSEILAKSQEIDELIVKLIYQQKKCDYKSLALC